MKISSRFAFIFLVAASIDVIAFTPANAGDCTPPPSGMVGWWSGDGSAYDIAGIANGSLNDDAGFLPGEVGQAFSFDGSGDDVSLGNPASLQLTTAITIDAWIYPTSLPAPDDLLGILTKWHQGVGDTYALWTHNNGGTLEVLTYIVGDTGGYAAVAGGDIQLNQFSHVAMVYNSVTGFLAVYVNGVPVGSTTVADAHPLIVTGTNVYIGSERDGAGRYFAGLIDEVEVFNRALSTSEILDIYNAGALGKCKPTIYVSNSGNSSIRQFDVNGTGTNFTTSGAVGPEGIAFDTGYSHLYAANNGNGSITKYDVTAATFTTFVPAGTESQPYGIAFDSVGNLYSTNFNTNQIDKIDPSGQVFTFINLTNLSEPVGLAFDGGGNLWVSNFGDGTIVKFAPNGTPTPIVDLTINEDASAIAFDKDGNAYVSGGQSNTIWKIDTSNAVTTFADSTDGLNDPFGLAFDQFGNLYVINGTNTISPSILKFDPAGNHVTFAGSTGLNIPTFIAIKPGIVPIPPPAPVDRQLTNISARAFVGTGDNITIAGMIIHSSGALTKKVLIRGRGPSLGFAGTLVDPVLELHDQSGVKIAENDSWKVSDGIQDQSAIEATGLQPSSDDEAALLRDLDTNTNYTAFLYGKSSTTGIGLVEVFDLDELTNAHLSNLSARAYVDVSDGVLIGGIIVHGTTANRFLFRARGPSFNGSGLDFLPDPQLDLHDEQGAVVAHNDNWKEEPDGTPNPTREAAILATGLAPANDSESAIIFTPSPGNYTAIVSGVGADPTGVGQVEVFFLGP